MTTPKLAFAARPLLFALAAASLMLFTGGSATARSVYDGSWSVLIITNKGTCDRGYRYSIRIRDGRIHYAGEASVNLSGRVDRRGRVRVRVSAGSGHASGSGRLNRSYGTGVWRGSGSAGTCSGTWTAERRG